MSSFSSSRLHLISFPQFDTYSYEKIHSHAGVRSDLFRRPLPQTLVTDFFGGVAQAEVLPSFPEALQPAANKVKSSHDLLSEQKIYTPLVLDPVSSYRTNNSYEIRIAPTRGVDVDGVFNVNSLGREGSTLVTLRAWASIVLTGGLVAWASLIHRK